MWWPWRRAFFPSLARTTAALDLPAPHHPHGAHPPTAAGPSRTGIMDDWRSAFAEEWDAIVMGTGMKECLLSGLLSVAGKKVLHLDRNSYYGGASASLDISQLFTKFGITDKPSEGPLAAECPPDHRLLPTPSSTPSSTPVSVAYTPGRRRGGAGKASRFQRRLDPKVHHGRGTACQGAPSASPTPAPDLGSVTRLPSLRCRFSSTPAWPTIWNSNLWMGVLSTRGRLARYARSQQRRQMQ